MGLSAFVVVVVVGAVGGAVGTLVKRALRNQGTLATSWRAFARERGFRYEPPTSLAEQTWPTVTGARADVVLTFDVFSASDLNELATVRTRVRGRAQRDVPDLRLSRREREDRPTAGARAAVVTTSDEIFDATFEVSAPDVHTAERFLDDDAREALLHLSTWPAVQVRCEAGTIELSWALEEVRHEVLDIAAAVVVQLGRYRHTAGYR